MYLREYLPRELSMYLSWKNVWRWVHRVCFYVLKHGEMPKHVAIIMDGNRRYAVKKGIERKQGHIEGLNNLKEVMDWCLHLGIKELSVYAFSIENFKRSKDEIDTLYDLMQNELIRLIKNWEQLRKSGIRIRVVGNLTLLPKNLVILVLVCSLITEQNNRLITNVFLAYTSNDEFVDTSYNIVRTTSSGKVKSKDLDEKVFGDCLYTFQSCMPELLIRTAGDNRLSKFLTWQCAWSYLFFADSLWPEFSAWDMMSSILQYQLFKNVQDEKDTDDPKHQFVSRYLSRIIQIRRKNQLMKFCAAEKEDANRGQKNEIVKFADKKKVNGIPPALSEKEV